MNNNCSGLHKTNRLAHEKSPYLLQHKYNPVDWYPWCDEAFERAKTEDKPILLSVGYSTCHWCHVMARESFEDAEVAKILNRDFICIKVDREERPDIDAVYMRACQAMTGSGGWPMTVFITPEQKPFFAGTYFPKHSRRGVIGFVELLERISLLWNSDRARLTEAGEHITASIADAQNTDCGEPSEKLLQDACDALCGSFDQRWGGFGFAPKFPTPHNLIFLMRCDKTELVCKTLTAMARGGIFDQIGGGFSRYSTDEKWLKPHFEKMLYDNALLIIAYTESYMRTHNRFYSKIAERTADYVIRELQSPDGGIYCGQDADSDGVEGKYYTFTPGEIKSVLGDEDGEDFCRLYGINARISIPNLIGSESDPWPSDDARIVKLYQYRRSRTRLHTDDKILLSWNAWTIISFAQGGYPEEAIKAQRFIEANMTDSSNRLYLRFRDGEAANMGQLDDYAVYALALLSLYRRTLNAAYLEQAVFRAEQMRNLFEDTNGGYFLTAHDAQELITRPKETYDGAIPSGNSVAAMLLENLAQLTGDDKWRTAADRQMRFMVGQAKSYPAGYCFAMLAMLKWLRPSRNLIVCGNEMPSELKTLNRDDLNILYKSSSNAQLLAKCAPFTSNYTVPEQGAVWYLCENGVCRAPVSNFEALDL